MSTGTIFELLHPLKSSDYEDNRFYGPNGPRYFIWLTSKQTNDFSQFDMDNSLRFNGAGYVQIAKGIKANALPAPTHRAHLHFSLKPTLPSITPKLLYRSTTTGCC